MKPDLKEHPEMKGVYLTSEGDVYLLTKVIKAIPPSHFMPYIGIRFRSSKMKINRNTTLHRLLAETFIPNPKKLPCVNHKDGNKTNNALENLEWCSYSDNMFHKFRVLGHKNPNPTKGKFLSAHHRAKKVIQFDQKTGKPIRTWTSIQEIEYTLCIPSGNIVHVCKGRLKSAGGFGWKYENHQITTENADVV